MVHAKEVREITKTFISNEIFRHLGQIERDIKGSAANGGWGIAYGNGLHGAKNEVRRGVWDALVEAGYRVVWHDNTHLGIFWDNKAEKP